MLYLPIDSEAGIPSPKTAESLATLSLSHLQDIASLQLAPPSDKSQHDADVAAFEATPINRGRLDTRHNPIHE